MERAPRYVAVLSLAALLVSPVQAQIKPPVAPTGTRSTSIAAPVPPQSPAPATSPASNDRSRDQLSSHPISSKGPSTVPLPAKPVSLLRVYDQQGRVLNSMKAAGPNRVLDTRTGRYYSTVPAGDGQRIVR